MEEHPAISGRTVRVSPEIIKRQYDMMEKIRKINEEYTCATGRERTATVLTYGCQMNEHDSEGLTGMLRKMGYTILSEYSLSDYTHPADLVILNTCCVRENAEEKIYGHLGALKGAKRANPDMITAVCGCMTEQQTVIDTVKSKFRNVDLLFGTKDFHLFPQYLYEVILRRKRVLIKSPGEGTVPEGLPVERNPGAMQYVTVMYGCNNFCSYCIVPYVRGRERSRYYTDILNEVRELANAGVPEVMLLGQNVNSYGKDIEYNDGVTDFADLLKALCDKTDIKRIRFMTSHPKDLSQKLIDVMASESKICRQLHLPVQSGSSRVLKMMNRHYTKEKYLDLVARVRKAMPDITLTTDIIVGFPGETEEDFSETLDLIEKVRFDSAFTFIYSPRTGTPAAARPDQIPEETVKQRFSRLLKLQNDISLEKNEALKGQILEVLCEGRSRTNPDRYTGRTSGNKVVNFDSKRDPSGNVVSVRIDTVQTWSLEGEEIL